MDSVQLKKMTLCALTHYVGTYKKSIKLPNSLKNLIANTCSSYIDLKPMMKITTTVPFTSNDYTFVTFYFEYANQKQFIEAGWFGNSPKNDLYDVNETNTMCVGYYYRYVVSKADTLLQDIARNPIVTESDNEYYKEFIRILRSTTSSSNQNSEEKIESVLLSDILTPENGITKAKFSKELLNIDAYLELVWAAEDNNENLDFSTLLLTLFDRPESTNDHPLVIELRKMDEESQIAYLRQLAKVMFKNCKSNDYMCLTNAVRELDYINSALIVKSASSKKVFFEGNIISYDLEKM